jgi:hypothetical protein
MSSGSDILNFRAVWMGDNHRRGESAVGAPGWDASTRFSARRTPLLSRSPRALLLHYAVTEDLSGKYQQRTLSAQVDTITSHKGSFSPHKILEQTCL